MCMITELNKKELYTLLKSKLNFNEPYPLAEVGKELNAAGHGCRRYGYARMKNFMKELKEFILLENYEYDGHSNTNVVLKEWNNKNNYLTENMVWANTSAEMAEVENEIGTGLLKINKSKIKVQTRELKRNKKKAEKKVTLSTAAETTEKKADRIMEKPTEVFEKGKVSEFLRLAYLPPKIMDILKRKGFRNPDRVLASAYQHSLNHQMLQVQSESITFPVKCGEEELVAILKKNDKPQGRPWYLSYVGVPIHEPEENRDDDITIPPGKSLEQFAELGSWQKFLSELSSIALAEPWDSDPKRNGRYYVLKKYIQYTFYRLLQEDKICISKDHKFAAFNTGLVNHHYDDIYACFVKNPQKEKVEWKFEAFAIAGLRGKDGYGKMLTSYFNPLPQVPKYIEKKEDLIYDLDKELLTDYEHIIIDNLRRLPKAYLKEGCYGDAKAVNLISQLDKAKDGSEEEKLMFGELSKYIAENDRIFRRLRSRMEDAIEIALKRVRWNFRTAIPCYFPKGNCMSLMLPLCLEDDGRTDAALIVQKNPSGSYQGQTVLRLEQAYLDARLICRPNTDWLQNKEVAKDHL